MGHSGCTDGFSQCKAMQELEEVVSELAGRVNDLECSLSDALQDINELEGIIEEYEYAFRERGIRLRGNTNG